MAKPIRMEYTNHRGERAWRTILPLKIEWKSTSWYPEEQYILTALDCEKGEERSFALLEIHGFTRCATEAEKTFWRGTMEDWMTEGLRLHPLPDRVEITNREPDAVTRGMWLATGSNSKIYLWRITPNLIGYDRKHCLPWELLTSLLQASNEGDRDTDLVAPVIIARTNPHELVDLLSSACLLWVKQENKRRLKGQN